MDESWCRKTKWGRDRTSPGALASVSGGPPWSRGRQGAKRTPQCENTCISFLCQKQVKCMGVPNMLFALSVHAPGVSAGSFNHRSGGTAFLTCLTGNCEIGDCKTSINMLRYVLFQPKNPMLEVLIFFFIYFKWFEVQTDSCKTVIEDSAPGPFPAASSPAFFRSTVPLQLCGWTCIFIHVASVSCRMTLTTRWVDVFPVM